MPLGAGIAATLGALYRYKGSLIDNWLVVGLVLIAGTQRHAPSFGPPCIHRS